MNRKRTEPTSGGAAARGLRIAIVVSRFNEDVTARLLHGAEECLKKSGAEEDDYSVYYCPGSFELPQVANKLASMKSWDAIICLGAVIKGRTPHFHYISSEAARGIQDVALRHSVPVAFGVLTTENEKQALERAGGKEGNKGWDAAVTALEMASLFRSFKRKAKRI